MPFSFQSLIPYESYDVVTDLSPEDIADRLDEEIVAYDEVFSSPDRDYIGRVSEERFKFREMFTGRSVFWRTTIGTITATDQGSIIHVRVRPPLGSIIVSAFISLICILVGLTDKPGSMFGIAIIYLMAMMDAKFGRKKAKEDLLDWVDGDLV